LFCNIWGRNGLKTLGLDIGTNSIGWCLIDGASILATGVRIFPDGREAKSNASLALGRRQARAMRRRRDRYIWRRKALLRWLTEYGLMPAEDRARDQLVRETGDGCGGDLSSSVYGLRTRALDEQLHLHQIGRILFHLDQRRGFKSNRKTDRGDNEAGKIAVGISRLEQEMLVAGARTYGEYLYKRRLDGLSVRTRLRPEAEEGGKSTGYDFYPSRAELEKEFDIVWAAQAVHHPNILTDARRDHIRAIIFHQRPLKAMEVGKCSYNSNEKRLAKAHPLFQRFRLIKELNELAIIAPDQSSRKLTLDERNALYAKLRSSKSASFSPLRRVLKLGPEFRFNKESDNRTKLLGDEVYVDLSKKEHFGPTWAAMPEDRQWGVIRKLRDEEDPEALRQFLTGECGLGAESAASVAGLRMPEGYGRVGETALRKMLAEMEADVITEAEAARRAGYHHSDKRTGEIFDELPPYQVALERHIPPGTGELDDPIDKRLGRLTNPTVHIGLNQLRRVVNAIIKRYGRPDEISVELARDLKLNEEQKKEVNRRIGQNTRDAERRSQKLIELKQIDNGYNRLRLKLWEELNDKPENRVCIYSGTPIRISMLFTAEVDVDHILPFSKTLDDSQANRILCTAAANRQKRNRAPADVTEWLDRYDEILERATCLPRNKQWRFARGALEKFEAEGGFHARQLVDTQYLSRMAKTYLESLYVGEESRVRVVPGRLTEMLRRKWGLNDLLPDHNYTETVKKKNRNDHRHHVIDAAVIAVTNRSLLQRISMAAARNEARQLERIIEDIPLPWAIFRDDLREAVRGITVSHKSDHRTVSSTNLPRGESQTAGQLHNDTAYGLTDERDGKGNSIVVRRKAITELKKEKDILAIRDAELRNRLWTATRDLTGKAFEEAVLEFSRTDPVFKGIRRVRMVEPLAVIPIRDRAGKPYKGYKGDANYRYDVWQLEGGKWVVEVMSMFDAHRPGWESAIRKAHHNPKKVLSLKQNDMVRYDHSKLGEITARVIKFGANGRITFAVHNEGGDLKRRDEMPNELDPGNAKYPDMFDLFKYHSPTAGGLKKLNIRQVRVDELGRVFDPGPRAT